MQPVSQCSPGLRPHRSRPAHGCAHPFRHLYARFHTMSHYRVGGEATTPPFTRTWLPSLEGTSCCRAVSELRVAGGVRPPPAPASSLVGGTGAPPPASPAALTDGTLGTGGVATVGAAGLLTTGDSEGGVGLGDGAAGAGAAKRDCMHSRSQTTHVRPVHTQRAV